MIPPKVERVANVFLGKVGKDTMEPDNSQRQITNYIEQDNRKINPAIE
jgi:hypothetical protein